MTAGNRAGRIITAASVSALLAGVTWLPAGAETAFDQLDVEQRGDITIEASWYPRTAKHTGQEDSFLHLEAQPEILVYGDTAEAQLQPRIGGGTSGAGQIDFREAHVSGRLGEMDYLVGSTILFWGKVESYNPVDIVNSRDFSRGLMRSEKRGAPMARVSWPLGPGQLDLMAIDFVENEYPALSARERPGLRITESTSYSGGAKRDDMAKAIRWSGYFGDIDLGLSWFQGTGHSPRLLPQADGRLKPDYSRITQAGLDIQYLRGDTALKAEIIHRKGQYDRLGTARSYRAGVFGVEHNLYDITSDGRDLVLLAEYARDSRKDLSHSGFQNDLTLGARWVWNDVEDTQVLGLLTRDLDNAAQTMTFSIDRRLTDELTFEASARLAERYERDPNSTALSQDSAVIASITYSF